MYNNTHIYTIIQQLLHLIMQSNYVNNEVDLQYTCTINKNNLK